MDKVAKEKEVKTGSSNVGGLPVLVREWHFGHYGISGQANGQQAKGNQNTYSPLEMWFCDVADGKSYNH
jgi:hypothetical protein